MFQPEYYTVYMCNHAQMCKPPVCKKSRGSQVSEHNCLRVCMFEPILITAKYGVHIKNHFGVDHGIIA